MFCSNCGKKMDDNARFCGNCGAAVMQENPAPSVSQAQSFANQGQSSANQGQSFASQGQSFVNQAQSPVGEENSPKTGKKKTGLIVGAVLAGVVLLSAAVGVGYWIYQNKIAAKEADAEDDDDDRKEKEIEKEEEEEVASESEEDEPVVSASAYEQLERYAMDDLQEEYGRLDVSASYTASYVMDETDSFAIPHLEPISGILTYKILDFDNDNQEEMLAVVLKDNAIYYQMYEITDDGVALQDEVQVSDEDLGTSDDTIWNAYMAERDGETYLIVNGTESVYVMADGTCYSLTILHYAEDMFFVDLEEAFVGSDFGGMEDKEQEVADRVAEIGFTASAGEMDFRLRFNKDAENADFLFNVTGMNMEYYNSGGKMYASYNETQDPAALGEIAYRFYIEEKAYRESSTVEGYDAKCDDYSVETDNGRMIEAYIEYPIFWSADEEVANWINYYMRDWADAYKADVDDNLTGYLEYLENDPYGGDWEYQPTSIDVVYYDENYVSVALVWRWYMGGVSNGGWKTINFDLKNREQVSLADIIGYSMEEAIADMVSALQADYGLDAEMMTAQLEDSYFPNFSFDDETVTVYFESYELNQGTMSCYVTLPRYK